MSLTQNVAPTRLLVKELNQNDLVYYINRNHHDHLIWPSGNIALGTVF